MKDLSTGRGQWLRRFSLATHWKAMVLLMMLCVGLPLSAQNITVSGTVEDSTGEPMIGATVLVDGSKDGVSTDIDGNFTLKNVSPKATLKVSYIGYKTESVKVEGRTSITVVLREDTETLDEVVVVGYGTVKKKDLTGSVSTVKGDDLVKVPTANVAQAMTGRLAGVQITTTDGSPDAEMVIRVRGGGSITGDNSPLYVVDGFPVSSISDINPADIADITVLKDASSTAIYGSQGANGVILITTKSPEGGKTTVTYNGYMQGKSINKKIDAMDPYNYAMFLYEKAALGGASAIRDYEKRFGSFADIDLYQYQEPIDWYEDAFNNHKLSQSHSVGVSGGSDKTKFNLNAAYINDEALIKDQGYSRFNLSLKLQHQIASNLRFEFGSRMSDTETRGAGTTGGKKSFRSYDLITKAPVNGLYDQIDQATMTRWTRTNTRPTSLRPSSSASVPLSTGVVAKSVVSTTTVQLTGTSSSPLLIALRPATNTSSMSRSSGGTLVPTRPCRKVASSLWANGTSVTPGSSVFHTLLHSTRILVHTLSML